MSAKAEEKKEEGGGKKKKPLPLIIGIVVLVVALFVGKTVMAGGKKDDKDKGKKSKSSKSHKHDEEESDGKKSKKHKDEEEVKVGHSLQLDEFLVNLNGSGDHYLKASLALGLKEGMTEEKAKEIVPMARDIIISALTEKSMKDLSSGEGRDKLKEDLLEKINEEAGEEAAEPVVKIYITAFATQ